MFFVSGKLTVILALVGSVSICHINLVAGYFLCIPYCIFKISVIQRRCSFYLYVGYKVWLTFLVGGLSQISTVPLDNLASLIVVLCIRVIGILKAFRTDKLLATYTYSTILIFLIFLVEGSIKKGMFTFTVVSKYVIDDKTQSEKTVTYLFRFCTIHSLGCVLLTELHILLSKHLVGYTETVIALGCMKKSLMDNLILEYNTMLLEISLLSIWTDLPEI